MCGLEYRFPFGQRSFSFAPFGLYAYPIIESDLKPCVRDAVRHLKSFRTTSFQWNVRYDHRTLAEELQVYGIPYSQTTTHVLPLNSSYETVFAGFNATIRNQVRRAQRNGLVVRRVHDEDSVNAYYDIHNKLAQHMGNYGSLQSRSLFTDLLGLKEDVIFLVAEVQNTIVAGGWFFRDGDSLCYWHAAMAREFSKLFPSCAIVNSAIQLGCSEGYSTFNMGGSVGIASLKQFKSSWGAVEEKVWQFRWRNPFWLSIQGLNHFFRGRALQNHNVP